MRFRNFIVTNEAKLNDWNDGQMKRWWFAMPVWSPVHTGAKWTKSRRRLFVDFEFDASVDKP